MIKINFEFKCPLLQDAAEGTFTIEPDNDSEAEPIQLFSKIGAEKINGLLIAAGYTPQESRAASSTIALIVNSFLSSEQLTEDSAYVATGTIEIGGNSILIFVIQPKTSGDEVVIKLESNVADSYPKNWFLRAGYTYNECSTAISNIRKCINRTFGAPLSVSNKPGSIG